MASNTDPHEMTPRAILRGLMDLPWGASLYGPLPAARSR